MSRIRRNLTGAFFIGAALNGLMVCGVCALYVMAGDAAGANRNPELAQARQTLAQGLRKLYQTNQDGGFTCYETSQAGFSCMNS